MATNLALDDALIEEARKIGGHRTKRDAVTAALRDYVQRHQQLRILELFGRVEYEPGYDHKKERGRKSR
jgi:Arc/MetJ family transcription regulator